MIFKVNKVNNLLPLGIAENNIANNKIKNGEPLAIDDVTLVENHLYRYWKKQIDIIKLG